MKLSSPAFTDGARIPTRYTCDGANAQPPLRWSGVPSGARSLALVVEDPDASPDTFVHWTIWNLRPAAGRMGASPAPGAVEGENSAGEGGWSGPCPPEDDEPHRYVFRLYALSRQLDLESGAAPADVRSAIAKDAVAMGRLDGRYGR
jgi:Raf kinase inhibitor-like YbhB/YbcL family protein